MLPPPAEPITAREMVAGEVASAASRTSRSSSPSGRYIQYAGCERRWKRRLDVEECFAVTKLLYHLPYKLSTGRTSKQVDEENEDLCIRRRSEEKRRMNEDREEDAPKETDNPMQPTKDNEEWKISC